MPDDDIFPTVDDVLAIHEDVVRDYGIPPGTRHPLPKRPIQNALDAAREVDDPYHRAAVLLRKLANAHVFEDGNKRTAYSTARTYLKAVGETPAPSKQQRVVVMKHFKRFDVDELADRLRTGEIDTSRLRTEYPE